MFEHVKVVDWARLAAFIDGEGCVYISKLSKGRTIPRYQLVLHLTNTDPRLLVWVARTFRIGSFLTRPMEGQRIRHDWTISSRAAAEVLRNCLPYFVMKLAQAELALAFQETKSWGRRKISTELLRQWEEMHSEMSALKEPPTGKFLQHEGTIQ